MNSRIDETTRELQQNNDRMESLQFSVGKLRGETQEAAAVAISLSGLRIPHGKDKAIAVRFGSFGSGNAIGALGALRLSDDPDMAIDFGVSYGFEYSQKGFTAGLTWSW